MAHLVFQTAFPGDLFLSIPLIKRIREWDPDSELVLACRPGLGDFFLQFGLVDRVIAINKRAEDGGASALRELRSVEWDHVFCPHESVRTALWMLRLRARVKVGFARWWNRFVFGKRVVKPMMLPDALRQLSLMTAVDARFAETFSSEDVFELRNLESGVSPVDYRSPAIPSWASMQILDHRPAGKKVFLAPGSVWATKRWTTQGYEELARLLLKRGYDVELVGSKDERALCDEIASRISVVPGSVARGGPAAGAGVPAGKLTNRAGETSLADLARAFSAGTALVSNDSGAMHVAAAAGLPTVAVFGPTTLDLGFRPWQNHALVVQKDLDCRPCGKHGHQKCPLGHHDCMEKIAAGEVMTALQSLLPT